MDAWRGSRVPRRPIDSALRVRRMARESLGDSNPWHRQGAILATVCGQDNAAKTEYGRFSLTS
jgi:hypothetical protein